MTRKIGTLYENSGLETLFMGLNTSPVFELPEKISEMNEELQSS